MAPSRKGTIYWKVELITRPIVFMSSPQVAVLEFSTSQVFNPLSIAPTMGQVVSKLKVHYDDGAIKGTHSEVAPMGG